MKELRIFVFCGWVGVCASARAVYAPIPDQEQGKDLTVSLHGGVTYDNNIFGAYTAAIPSMIYELAPGVVFNASMTPQTFVSASYKLALDYYENRPGQKLLDNHNLDARLAHAFSKQNVLDVTDALVVTHNPESLLGGVPVNTDQSYLSNEAGGRFAFAPSEKVGMVLKARSTYYDYFNSALGDSLNRVENLFGLEGDYTLLPELKAAGEYRHQDINYIHGGALNNKHSEFLMGGADYSPGPRLSASFRLGAEWRRLANNGSQTAPHAEFTVKYDYAKGSYVSAGYSYDLAETSDPAHYSDERTNRIFISVQHALTARVVASASVDYEPSRLVGLAQVPDPADTGTHPVPDLNETGTHAGGALTYVALKNWLISATYDYDFMNSGDPTRGMNRSRTGLNGTYTF